MTLLFPGLIVHGKICDHRLMTAVSVGSSSKPENFTTRNGVFLTVRWWFPPQHVTLKVWNQPFIAALLIRVFNDKFYKTFSLFILKYASLLRSRTGNTTSTAEAVFFFVISSDVRAPLH